MSAECNHHLHLHPVSLEQIVSEEFDRVVETLQADESLPARMEGLKRIERALGKKAVAVLGKKWLKQIMLQLKSFDSAMKLKIDYKDLQKVVNEGSTSGYNFAREKVTALVGDEIEIDFGRLSEIERATKALLENKGLILSEYLGGDVIAKVKLAVVEGVLAGKDMRRIAREIEKTGLTKGVFKSIRARAETIARTEVISAAKNAQLDAVKSSGIERLPVRLITANDACPICQDIAAMGSMTPEAAAAYGNIHPRCRCSWVPAVGDLSKWV